uniref:hypothetical protein n=1 Tax=Prevotella sp. TaxID=59823 RepID=UPI004026D8F2
MGKSCANERNESSLSNCRVQPALSIKEGRGDFRKEFINTKEIQVGFRKNPSLRLREDWWILRNDAIKKHHFASFGTISHDMFYLASLPNKIIVSLHCHSERMNLVHSSNTLTKI